jgi:hypothetical protein
VAIAAPYIALRDLLEENSDAESLVDHPHDVLAFAGVRTMIEIQDAQVGDAAIDARVEAKI